MYQKSIFDKIMQDNKGQSLGCDLRHVFRTTEKLKIYISIEKHEPAPRSLINEMDRRKCGFQDIIV